MLTIGGLELGILPRIATMMIAAFTSFALRDACMLAIAERGRQPNTYATDG